MNEEKNVMQTGNSAGEYLSPSVKVVVIKPRRIMCQSGGTEDSSEGNINGWY